MPTDPVSTSDCGAALQAVASYATVTTGYTFTSPVVDLTDPEFALPSATDNPLYADVSTLTNADLTTGVVSGTGTFDVLMASVKAHLKDEWEEGRLTASEYSKAYVELTAAGLGNSVQFLLSREQAYWQAILVQEQAKRAEIEAVTAAVGLETAKVNLGVMTHQMNSAEAQYALTKMKIATEDATFCRVKAETAQKIYETEAVLPAQVDNVTYQTSFVLPGQVTKMASETTINDYQSQFVLPAQVTNITYQTDNVLPSQKAVTDLQASGVLPAQIAKMSYETANILPKQVGLLLEQTESQRAQTLDTRIDGTTPIAGSIQKQKDLYTQQIAAYVTDGQYKAAKMYLDAWVTQKSLDEALDPPTEFTNTAVNYTIAGFRTNTGLV